MPDDAPHFDDQGRLIAPAYDDVYFSAEDGLAETEHVFLSGNALAPRLAALHPNDTFTIGETGFGTGLNFLAAWKCFQQHAPQGAMLHFVSVEGFPLEVGSIRKALAPWPQFKDQAEAMLAQWGGFWPGVHRLRFEDGRVRLTLLIGEAAEALASLKTPVDAWFLDGFAPSRNPAMWSEAVLAHVARCSAPGTTLATYTAAGFVRRGLQQVGFDVEKQPGFGTKRDMTVGEYMSEQVDPPLAVACKATRAAVSSRAALHPSTNEIDTAMVIGGSIAGAFAARSLAERGVAVTVIERQPMIDDELPSLTPRVAVLQPKVSDINDATGQWLREGFADAYRWLCNDPAFAQRSGWHACGAFQAAHDERSARRLRRFDEQFAGTGLCRWVQAEQTESEIGVGLGVGGLLIERAGMLRPAGLCAGLLDHPNIRVRDNTSVISLTRSGHGWAVELDAGERLTSDAVVVANALDAKRFEATAHLELKPVRGQVTLLDASNEGGQARPLNGLHRPLFYGGYVLPVVGAVQTLGASFVPGDSATAWRETEHADVCGKLARVLPDEARHLSQVASPSGWVGLRTTTPTHRCYAEQIEDGLYVSLGHGSHGIASAARAAAHLADLVTSGTR